jgi:hypothetical protein
MGIDQPRLRLGAIKLNAESILFTSNGPNASSLLCRCSKKGRGDYENKRNGKLTIDQRHRIKGPPVGSEGEGR